MTNHKRTTPHTFKYAQKLRKRPTPAEAKLWSRLCAHQLSGIGFRRQHAIGDYIVDFVAPRPKLIVELDGCGHAEQAEYDAERTRFLEAKGYRVIRFSNAEVHRDIEGVLRKILAAVQRK